MINAKEIWKDIERMRSSRPLIHNITNYVVMNSTANALLAIGSSPVMAHAEEEAEEMAGLASALVLNMGTLSPSWVSAMKKAQRKAREVGKPVIFDPVGAGATSYRTNTASDILAGGVTIVRGNASEILSLESAAGGTKGVDSTAKSDNALSAAKNLLKQGVKTVTISGETDYILSEQRTFAIRNGNAMMPLVTGLGCTASALTGAFAAVNPDPGEAAANAMAVMGICGEIAATNSRGPGSFQTAFIDALYNLTEKDIAARLQAEVYDA